MKNQAKSLFFVVAVPVHIWAIIVYLLSAPDPKGAGGWGDTLAIGSYILLAALLESLVISLVFFLLGLLFPQRWGADRRLGALVCLFFMVAVWTMAAQLLPIWQIPDTSLTNYIRINLTNTLLYRQIAYAGAVVFIIATLIAAVFIGKTPKVSKFIGSMIERFEALAVLYLLLDLGAFAFVLWRNY